MSIVVRNRHLREQYEAALAAVENLRPPTITVEQVGVDAVPIDLGNGIVAPPGSYYNADSQIVIAADDIGGDGSWEEA